MANPRRIGMQVIINNGIFPSSQIGFSLFEILLSISIIWKKVIFWENDKMCIRPTCSLFYGWRFLIALYELLGDLPGPATGAPVAALVKYLLL